MSHFTIAHIQPASGLERFLFFRILFIFNPFRVVLGIFNLPVISFQPILEVSLDKIARLVQPMVSSPDTKFVI